MLTVIKTDKRTRPKVLRFSCKVVSLKLFSSTVPNTEKQPIHKYVEQCDPRSQICKTENHEWFHFLESGVIIQDLF